MSLVLDDEPRVSRGSNPSPVRRLKGIFAMAYSNLRNLARFCYHLLTSPF